jgi:hypothetical protein
MSAVPSYAVYAVYGVWCMVYGVSEYECMYECSTFVCSVWCLVCQSMSACMYECSTFVCSVWCMVCQSRSACRTMYECSTVDGSTFVCSVWCVVC